MTKISICVPSRNRQFWFQQTIRALLESKRGDVEFVFADNSDDASVMARFMEEFAGDPRIVYLPPGPRIYPMLDNWERTVAATSGDWVTVIGDDDYVDPDLAGVLARIDRDGQEFEALDWLKISYFWPGQKVVRSSISVRPDSQIIAIPKERLFRRLFLWDQSTCVPSAGYSIYHSAISRRLLERVRRRFGGRYFEHPTVDYDNAYKVVLEGETFGYTSRPFSIHGRSPASSSATMMGGVEAMAKKNVEFMTELGRDLRHDIDPDVPVDHQQGVTGSVLQTMLWVLRTQGLKVDGWQVNFANACAENCHLFNDRAEFNRMAEGYRQALSNWEGGKYLRHFNPIYPAPRVGEPFTGVDKGVIYIRDDESVFATPAALYGIIKAMFEEYADMPIVAEQFPVLTPSRATSPATLLRLMEAGA